mmetsp:Transcript_8976/g.33107  ORF Transcript_8976/g.33107 Transcript_8976/m.33107 type:complete len:596 (-) Transcript_8976:71-1858(-)
MKRKKETSPHPNVRHLQAHSPVPTSAHFQSSSSPIPHQGQSFSTFHIERDLLMRATHISKTWNQPRQSLERNSLTSTDMANQNGHSLHELGFPSSPTGGGRNNSFHSAPMTKLRLNVSHLNEKRHKETKMPSTMPSSQFHVQISSNGAESSGSTVHQHKRAASKLSNIATKQHIRSHSGKRYSSRIYKKSDDLSSRYGYEPEQHDFLSMDALMREQQWSQPTRHPEKKVVRAKNVSVFNGTEPSLKIVNVNETRLLHDRRRDTRRHSSVLGQLPAPQSNDTSSSMDTVSLNVSNTKRRHSEKIRQEQQMYKAWKAYTQNSKRRVEEMQESLKKQEIEQFEKKMLIAQNSRNGAVKFLSVAEFDYWQSQKKMRQRKQPELLPDSQIPPPNQTFHPSSNSPNRKVSVVSVDATALPHLESWYSENGGNVPRRNSLAPRPKTPPSFWLSSRRRASTPSNKSPATSKVPATKTPSSMKMETSASPQPSPSNPNHLPPRPRSQATVRRIRKVPKSPSAEEPLSKAPDHDNLSLAGDRSSSAPLVRENSSHKTRNKGNGVKTQIVVSSASMPISERSSLRSRGAGAFYKKYTSSGSRERRL